MRTRLELAEAMSVDDYRAALAKREAMRSRFHAVAAAGDAMITLSSAGPAPFLAGNSGQGQPRLTHTPGLPALTGWPHAIGRPAVPVPLPAVRGVPGGRPNAGARTWGGGHRGEAPSQ